MAVIGKSAPAMWAGPPWLLCLPRHRVVPRCQESCLEQPSKEVAVVLALQPCKADAGHKPASKHIPAACPHSLVSSQRPGAGWQSAAGQVGDPLHRGGGRPMPSHQGPCSPGTPEPGAQDSSTTAILMVHSACPELSCLAHT